VTTGTTTSAGDRPQPSFPGCWPAQHWAWRVPSAPARFRRADRRRLRSLTQNGTRQAAGRRLTASGGRRAQVRRPAWRRRPGRVRRGCSRGAFPLDGRMRSMAGAQECCTIRSCLASAAHHGIKRALDALTPRLPGQAV